VKSPLIVASDNPEKQALIANIAAEMNVQTFLPEQMMAGPLEIAENGISYLENALLKASKLNHLLDRPCIADDFGMEIAGLGGKPGIHTRRWGGRRLGDIELLEYTIERIRTMNLEERICNFVGVGVIVLKPGSYISATEADKGILLTAPRGPLIPGHPLASLLLISDQNKTLAELREKGYFSKDIRIYRRLLREYLVL
jgi:XTP/dITP diphosphohydrolase